MLTNLINGVAIKTVRLSIVEGIEHVFIDTFTGALIHIMPHLNKVRKVCEVYHTDTTNRYYASYSLTEKAFYFKTVGRDLVEYYPLTGVTNVYNVYQAAGWPTNILFGNGPNYEMPDYFMSVADDGHVYLFCNIGDGMYGYARFNTQTKEIDDTALMPDREFTHIHGKGSAYAFKIADTPSLNGVYSSYLFADDYTYLRPTILSEIASSGLAFSNSNEILLNYSDRAVSSPTRRIYAMIGSGNTWKVIDIKSPAVFIDTNSTSGTLGLELKVPNEFTCVNQDGNTLNQTNWSNRSNIKAFASEFGITLPSYDVEGAKSFPFKIGRFVYMQGNRLSSNLFYNYAIHPITKQAIYNYAFDKYATYLNNPNYVLKLCNFRGDFGFSSNNEIVLFFLNTGSPVGIGFIRPDTNVFYSYNYGIDPDNYVIADVDVYDINDPNGYGIRWGGTLGSAMTEELINGETCYIDSVGKSAVVYDFNQIVENKKADVSFKVYPQKSSSVFFDFEVNNVATSVADISQTINLRDELLVAVGKIYTGVVVIDQTSSTTFNLKKYIGGTGSPNGVWRIDSNRVFIGVYMGQQYIIDATDPDNAAKISLVGGDVIEALYASVRADGLVFSGIVVRQVSHQSGFRLTHVNLNTYAVTGITNKFPTEFNALSSGTYRTLVGLPNDSYNDATVEAAVQARMTAAGLTRAQVIAEFVDSCRWSNSDMHSWGNYTVFGLSYTGRRKLSNIRIEETVGSGVWIDQNYQPATYNKALLVNSTDIKNLQPSEIKVVELQIGVSNYLGRVAGTDNYLAWVNHKIADGQGVVQIISKSNFIAAANGGGVITSFDNIATVEFGGTSLASVGFGDSNYFDSASTQQINCIASKGDYLYITMRSLTGSSPYPAIMRVNCADGTQTVFARTATNAVRAISINANKMVITTGSSVQVVDDFESATLPITI